MAQWDSLLRFLTQKPGALQAVFWRLWGWGGESSSKLIRVVGRIQFPEAVEQKSPFPYWLSVRSFCLHLKSTCMSVLLTFPCSSPQHSCDSFSFFEPLWIPPPLEGAPPPLHVAAGRSSLLLETHGIWEAQLNNSGESYSLQVYNFNYSCKFPFTM